MCGAGGLRGRERRRQGTHCEGYCKAMLSAPWTAKPRLEWVVVVGKEGEERFALVCRCYYVCKVGSVSGSR